MSITAKVETITKDVALKYLEQRSGNRPINEMHLRDLMGRQKRGEWKPNGDTIRFDSDGKLRDGQHRLTMVVNTELPFETVVVRGINPDAFITIDTGRKRSLGDVLGIDGYEHSPVLAHSVRYLRYYVSRRYAGFSYEQQRELLKKHLGLITSLNFYLGLEAPAGGPGRQSIFVALHYLFSQVSEEASNDFIERLVTGLHLNEPNDPVYRLRGQLIYYKSARVHPNEAQIFGIAIFAWNAKQQGREQKVNFKVPSTLPIIRGFPKELMEARQLELEEKTEDENSNT